MAEMASIQQRNLHGDVKLVVKIPHVLLERSYPTHLFRLWKCCVTKHEEKTPLLRNETYFGRSDIHIKTDAICDK
jgi:hypothetical protein